MSEAVRGELPESSGQRLKGKVAIVIGAGQSAGETIGNGRATVLRFVQEGAVVLAVDRDLGSAQETAEQATSLGGTCIAFEADIEEESQIATAVAHSIERWGKLDILHNNVGVSIAGGDAPLLDITAQAFDHIAAVNLRGPIMACKHALPIMRRQQEGVIINISSIAARENYPLVGYKATKAALDAFTRQLALDNARYGIRANVISPGLIDTPMGVDVRVRRTGKTRAEVVAERNAQVPLRGRMGTAWDVANAAVFLASEEASFITGVTLRVDGGALA